jgi:glycosyltransferase involved in cell wall biosynthesis
MKLAVIASHPIQYQAPLYRELAQQCDLQVWFGHVPGAQEQGRGFGIPFQWDLPLRDGYNSALFAENFSRRGGGWMLGQTVLGLRRELCKWQPQAVLFTGWHHRSMLAALPALWHLPCPLLLRQEANLNRPRNFIQRLWHRRILRHFDWFLPIGTRNREYFQAFGVLPERMIDCPYAVDNERFAHLAGKVDRRGMRATWGLTDEDCVFLFVGKLEPKKRPQDLLKALHLLRQKEPKRRAKIVYVGQGEGLGLLRATAQALGLSEAVVFPGFLNQGEIPAAYAVADALVLPSDAGETWGLVVNEAMACGRPAVVSEAVGCAPDLILEGRTGYTFPVGNVPALAEVLGRLSANRSGLVEIGRQARQHVEAFSVQRAAAAVLGAARGGCCT